jgi:hypothetical protein
VTALDVVHLKFYSEYQWLLDFAVYSSIVYILTEVSNTYFLTELYVWNVKQVVYKIFTLCLKASHDIQYVQSCIKHKL